jgi:hypothetical protein
MARIPGGLRAGRPLKGAIALCPYGLYRSIRTLPSLEITTVRRLVPRTS